jgi:beta-xylosidase
MKRIYAASLLLAAFVQSSVGYAALSRNSTYKNPTLPGWHSDPSCVFVPEEDNTFFCATSTFLLTPGVPIYASKDLLNWKLASHVITKPSQMPYVVNSTDQNDGIFAPTLRYHKGTFYVITVYVFRVGGDGLKGLLFKSTNPYKSTAWGDPIHYKTEHIDPDLFWDDDGKVYLTTAGMYQTTIDVETGATGSNLNIWNGTGGPYPEGPHIYKKDGYYYLMISEGGTELGHEVTIARSKKVSGPYHSYENNPILTNRNTTEYFQTVGHADLFQDVKGDWWAMGLSTRSGPEWKNYPMGREGILAPVSWKQGAWPVIDPIRGQMSGWALPPMSINVPGEGSFFNNPDVVDFKPGKALPAHFSSWRWPQENFFKVTSLGLRLEPSKTISLNGNNSAAGQEGITLLMRRQTDTYFQFSVDVSYHPKVLNEESGVTVFLTQAQHVDLSIVLLMSKSSKPEAQLRLRSTGTGNYDGPQILITRSIPPSWQGKPISLQIEAKNDTHYIFSAASSVDRSDRVAIGVAPATIVSGGTGPFTGSLVGVFATSDGGNGRTMSYIQRWRYYGTGQKINN